ncbi:MAG: efflux RND transporter permease subunit [Deltaproteobacteria bacterium]|nr:efflux RND transporter permease subunit [Deltaproteobacteria bacterium]
MQKLAEICIRRPVFAAMLILALVVVGLAGYFRLGIDRFPSVDLPTVIVRTQWPGASTEEMETEISKRLEEVVNTIEGIDELRSISGPGNSVVIVTFSLKRNIDAATQDVRDRVAAVLKNLPNDVTPPQIAKSDNDAQPVLTVALSGDRALRELTELAEKVVKVRLERSTGVGEVQIVGGLNRAMNIWVEADRLEAYQLPITTVRDAIAQQNKDSAGGNVTSGAREDMLRTLGKLSDAQAFDNLVIATINGAPVRVRDIGRAEDGTREQRSAARLNGVPTVILEVRRQSGANTVAVIEAAKKNMALAQRELPAGIGLTVIQDQSRYIYAALHEINLHLILGSILASLVVLAFMRNWRSTLIAAVAIPASVISTFGMMRALDFTLNSVTMLALVLMVGVVIDDAIVVLENIYRFVEEKRLKPFEAARAATADIGLAVMATTLSLVVIFIPVSFMSSISGRFLYQFGITAAVAVMVSLLVSFTLTPMMSARLLKAEAEEAGGGEPRSRGGFYRRLDSAYSRILSWAMSHRLGVVLIAAAVILSTIPLYKLLKLDYLPGNVDEGEFNVQITAPQGTSLTAMDEIMRTADRELRSLPGVRLVLATAGGSFIGGVNEGRIYVQLLPHAERVFSPGLLLRKTFAGRPLDAFTKLAPQKKIMQEARKRFKKYRDLRVSVRNITGFNIGGSQADIDFVLRGTDLQALFTYSESLRTRSEALGIMDADTTLKLDKPELRLSIDRARADDLGLDPGRIGTEVRLLVGGDPEVSRFRDPALNEDYDVQLRLREEDRGDPAVIGRLYVSRLDGSTIRLDNVARIERVKSPSRIDRLDRQREVRLRASVAPGYGLADRIAVLRDAFEKMRPPAGYTTSVSGRGRELERTFSEFVWAFALSIIFMYMILASQFENLVHPLTILLSLPLTVPFALFSLWIAGNTLNLYAALGILVLFGVVKKNAILQIDHMNNLRAAGMERTEAILLGNRNRLRPILMTTLTFVAGMIPLAIGSGPGSEERRVIAVVVIGGQTLSLLLTLIATPVVYSLLDDLGRVFSRRRRPGGREDAA